MGRRGAERPASGYRGSGSSCFKTGGPRGTRGSERWRWYVGLFSWLAGRYGTVPLFSGGRKVRHGSDSCRWNLEFGRTGREWREREREEDVKEVARTGSGADYLQPPGLTWILKRKVREDSSWGAAPKRTAGSDWPAGAREGRRGSGLECGLGGSYWSAVGRKAVAASGEGVGPLDGQTRTVHAAEL